MHRKSVTGKSSLLFGHLVMAAESQLIAEIQIFLLELAY